jgi:cytoskeleton protein RodZ
LASFGIGAKLRQERLGRGLTIDDIARETRIRPRFLEAIEAEDFESLPGLLFARNFVRQFALSLKLDPDPLVSELPKPDESTIRLPDPPAYARSSYQTDRRMHSAFWLAAATMACVLAWFHFNHSGEKPVESLRPVETAEAAAPAPMPVPRNVAPSLPVAAIANPTPSAPVQVVMTARQPVWIQVSADGKNTFSGTLEPNETRQISAVEQIKLTAGNAGGLTISLNGKTLEPLGSIGQVRVVRLTAAGPVFLERDPQPAPDPL